jgi:hypothetical protein
MSYAFSYSFNLKNGQTPYAQTGNVNNNQNPMQSMMLGLGMLCAGLDMIDNGQLDGSIFQMLAGGKPQQAQQYQNQPYAMAPQQNQPFQPAAQQNDPIAMNKALGAQMQDLGADLKDDGIRNNSHKQQQNPMMQMMQMMFGFLMGIMQMMGQMFGMNPQQQQQNPLQQTPFQMF